MPHIIYLDESGDLGWTFDKPYRDGGSSRYLTIAYIILPCGDNAKPKRVVRNVYRHFNFDPKEEIKGSMLDNAQLDYTSYKISEYAKLNPTFKIGTITTKKENVQEHIRSDSNKLYNYMIRLALVDKIDKFPEAHLIRDNRTIKVINGNIIGDYLQTVLWFERNSKTKLFDCPEESHQNDNLLFIDWVSHIIWSKFEDNEHKHFLILAKHTTNITLFF